MRTIGIATAVSLAFGSLVTAQERPGAEIGTSLGVTILSGGGESVTHFGIPGTGIFGQPTMYVTIPSGPLLLEPQIAFNIFSSDGETATTVGLGGQVGYAFQGAAVNSAYIAGSGAFQSLSGGGDSESDFGAGAALGYRIMLGTSGVMRVEGRFRRWFDSELNEFALALGFAVRLK